MLENVPSSSRNIVLQAQEDGTNVGDQVNPMKEDDIDNTFKNGGINRLIQDIFAPMDDNFDDIHDVPLIEKSQQPLYGGLIINILYAILLLMNLKVLNGLSNTCLTQIIKYAM